MLVRNVVAAAIGAVMRRTASENKGKNMALADPYQRDYGTATRSDRRPSFSGSRSGERLHSVPEDVNDSPSDYGGGPSVWNHAEEDGNDDPIDPEQEDWEDMQYDYRRAIRIYCIVPIGSAIFFVFAAVIPELIARRSLPSAPTFMRIILSIILSASLWTLNHALRIPLYSTLNILLSNVFTWVSTTLRLDAQRARRLFTAGFVTSLTSLIHVFLMTFLQEALRIASFAIVDLHWHRDYRSRPANHQPRTRDAAFREVWWLALGWALAEVCAGVIQGYEQLALYADMDSAEQTIESTPNNGDEEVTGNGLGKLVIDEEAVDLVSRSMPCVDMSDDDDVEAVKSVTRSEIDFALTRLANIRARDDLEDLYGQPYIEIPVFIPLLQRLDSILLSLGITLLLAAAYLPKPPSDSTLTSHPHSPFPSITQPALHIDLLTITPTYFVVTFLHAILGALYASPILPRIGIPAAAYTSCIVGLALTFAGVGIWAGVW
ncbi:uncharacterized protein FOMMEDRAFT_166712 [Fomitiporia mediterranea MF3/22]|uniref:uncharacterized protein n=1 Tax=Fomitiporia mediterranea (strain MF3/22) TaxID=694068 RepID=UPI00044075B7|nr:uncharacterized protein FOMMEDRAFT_166712 [Fomitiporia mediterranea MF3/22]EJD05005.1 hypothetical protein FOMMEDRAFT_166712 [Fomitiporia mediterranea MF3/22]